MRFGRVLSAEIRRRWSAFSGAALCNSLRDQRERAATRPLRMERSSGARLLDQRLAGVPVCAKRSALTLPQQARAIGLL